MSQEEAKNESGNVPSNTSEQEDEQSSSPGDESSANGSSLPPPPPPSSEPPAPAPDAKTTGNANQNSPSSHRQSPSLYISSASSSSRKTSRQTIDAGKQQQQQPKKSDFFIPYDSDASGSSFVVRQQHQHESLASPPPFSSPPTPTKGGPSRDRFPSFDSHASSGSIRFVSPRTESYRQRRQSNPQMLPYHERKKLQQQQKLKQPPSPQRQLQPPYPPHMMMMMPPPLSYGAPPPQVQMDPNAVAAFHSIYGGFPPHQQPPGFPPSPNQHQQHQSQPQQQFPPGFYMPPPMPPGAAGYPPQPGNPGYPPFVGMPPPPPLPQGGPPSNGQQQQHQQQQPPFMPPLPMPFYQPPPPQSPHLQQHHQAQSRDSAPNATRLNPYQPMMDKAPTRNTFTAPAPAASAKPPIVPRDDSSMSSLGSVGETSDQSDSIVSPRHRRNSSASSTGNFFVDVFAALSPRGGSSATNTPEVAAKQQIQMPPQQQAAFLQMPNLPFRTITPPEGPSPTPVRQRLGSQDRPPASRGTHQRLTSITNDDWDESGNGKKEDASSLSGYSSNSDVSGSERNVNERTALLPPSGISTNEREHNSHRRRKSRSRRSRPKPNYDANGMPLPQLPVAYGSSRRRSGSDALLDAKHKKKMRKKQSKKQKKSRRKASHRYSNDDSENDETSDSSYDYRRWTMQRARMLERERAKVHEQWKKEYEAESMRAKQIEEQKALHRRCVRIFAAFRQRLFRFMTSMEMFIANLPLAIGAIAMAVVTLGVVWFKFTEENLESCERVHFHSSQCTFPEFPGCFYCDTRNPLYRAALNFHYGCNVVAGFLALLFVTKVVLATRVVVDELASPITASPAGLLCMTTVCVFAGRGLIGQVMVSLASSIHLGLVIWYIYMALAYQIMPEPTWFPNTIGIGLSAVKTWLYYPMPGHLLMAISLSLNIFFFPISLIRVAVNKKISATIGWMQMSAPAVSLYALTIMAQPSFEEENPDVTSFQRVHRMIYLPCMHFMCGLSLIGFFASCHSLVTRWDDLRKRPFSPAHAAFCFPTLSHANAIQSYRGAVLTFSDVQPHDWRLIILYTYWFIVLLGGTIATVWISTKFLLCLPEWTHLDLADEEEPPEPANTILSMQEMITAGETMKQSYVSPAILQANETGALVLTRSGPDGRLRYVRTRRLPALGFEPTMKWSEMQRERELLLEWVGRNPPRRRNRTLSVPGIDFGRRSPLAFGTANTGVYGISYGQYSPVNRADGTTGW